MDNIKKLKDIILELNEVTEAEHIKSITSSVTTSWGEEVWDHEKISRDIDSIDDITKLRSIAKSYIKLYLKQQEVIAEF